MTVDFRIASGPNINMLVLIPVSDAARAWSKAHLPADAKARADQALVEPKFAVVIIDEILRPAGPVH